MCACFAQGLLHHGTALCDLLIRHPNLKDPRDPLCNAILPKPHQHPGMYLCIFRLYPQQGSEPVDSQGSLECLFLVPFDVENENLMPAVPKGTIENDKAEAHAPHPPMYSPPVHKGSLMQPCWVGLACSCDDIHLSAFPFRLYSGFFTWIVCTCIYLESVSNAYNHQFINGKVD